LASILLLLQLQEKMSDGENENASLTKQYVEAGACLRSDGVFSECTLKPSFCGSSSRSSRQIKMGGLGTYEYRCLSQKEVQTVTVGSCRTGVDRNQCTSSAEACEDSASFSDEHGECIVRGNRIFSVGDPTLFPVCEWRSGNSACVWDAAECPLTPNGQISGSETASNFLTAFEGRSRKNGDCTCDFVETGACKGNNDNALHCAVIKEACDDDSTWIPRLVLQRDYQIDCRLCDTLPEEHNENRGDGTLINGIADERNSAGGGSDDGRNRQKIVGGSVGGVFALTLLVVFVAVRKRRASTKGIEESDTDTDTNSNSHNMI
jgi:hypothetical protein